MLPNPSGNNNPYKSFAAFYCLFFVLGIYLIKFDSWEDVNFLPYTLMFFLIGAKVFGPLFFKDDVRICMDKIGSTQNQKELMLLVANYAFRRGIAIGIGCAIVKYVFRFFFF